MLSKLHSTIVFDPRLKKKAIFDNEKTFLEQITDGTIFNKLTENHSLMTHGMTNDCASVVSVVDYLDEAILLLTTVLKD